MYGGGVTRSERVSECVCVCAVQKRRSTGRNSQNKSVKQAAERLLQAQTQTQAHNTSRSERDNLTAASTL